MEGRRVSRQNQKYNPLFILFLCLVAAVIVLLIVSIVLGARLGKANKGLKAAETEIAKLEQNVSQLEDDLAAARSRASGASSSAPSGPSSTQPALPGSETASSSWLDLSGHDEVKVKPTQLLDAYATYYTTAGVNLRSGPATSYDRITTVDYGTRVDVAARDGNWAFAKVGSRFGWISSDYLSTSQPSPQTTSSSTSASSNRSEATSGSLRR